MLKKYLLFLCFLFPCQLLANNCLSYKQTPNINLSKPDVNIQIIQPDEEMDINHHGNVVASMYQELGITTEIIFVKSGFCVVLKDININLGYNDFLVKIDKNYKKNTCAYNSVMAHEQKHIDTYLSLIDEYESDIKNTYFTAADSVMPIFIEKKSDFDNAVEIMNKEIQNHPDLILLFQKIKAEEEIRNKKIDQLETGEDLMKCFE